MRIGNLPPATAVAPLDPAAIRNEFPIFQRATSADRPLAYLDSAATTQKPTVVLDAVREFYEGRYGAIARGVYRLSAEATALYEAARESVARSLGATAEEIVFVRGTTEAINLVAASWGGAQLSAGDEILVTGLEHHSNLVPWHRPRCAPGGSASSPRRMSRTLSGRFCRWPRSRDSRTRRTLSCWSTGRNRFRACRSMSARSAATSSLSRDTSATRRTASARSGPVASCWTPCRPTRAVAE
jgi:hypothetical protein